MFRRKKNLPAPVHLGCAVSRNDFLDSLRLLEARLNVPHAGKLDGLSCEIQEATLNCDREVWERVIGPPRNIVCHYSPEKRGIYHTWEHHWIGGHVKCYGCLFERAGDSHWLVLSRVVFFDTRAETVPRRPHIPIEHQETARQPA